MLLHAFQPKSETNMLSFVTYRYKYIKENNFFFIINRANGLAQKN